MWQPDPEWTRIPGGRGTLTDGVWRAGHEGQAYAVKRVRVPGPDDPVELQRPSHPGYWRRELEVALADLSLQGLVPTRTLRSDEDAEGYTVWSELVVPEPVTGLLAAAALGRFASQAVPDVPWLSRTLLRTRLGLAEERGGWPTLARTTVADLADALWRRREALLDRYDALPQVLAHGDAVPANLLATVGDNVVALDWASLGTAPAGADLGYFALSSREDFDVLLKTFTAHHAAPEPDIAFAARVMAVYTVVAQAEWALARVAGGEGALAGKYRHPSVAPYLRALQRQFPQIEALLQDPQASR
jgi:hypothetical protein